MATVFRNVALLLRGEHFAIKNIKRDFFPRYQTDVFDPMGWEETKSDAPARSSFFWPAFAS
jgi:hypothetical protein